MQKPAIINDQRIQISNEEENDELSKESNDKLNEELDEEDSNKDRNYANKEVNNLEKPISQEMTRKETNKGTANIKTLQYKDPTKKKQAPVDSSENLPPTAEKKRQTFCKSTVFVYSEKFIANFFNYS